MVFLGTARTLVASAVNPRAIRGPGLLLKQGLIGRSRSSRGWGSRREVNGKREGTMGRRRRRDGVSEYTVGRVRRRRGDERVRARVMRGIGRRARFRGYSTTRLYKGQKIHHDKESDNERANEGYRRVDFVKEYH
jgi:hypothetical protein